MTKNPLVNAFSATLYIAVVSSIMNYGSKNFGPNNSVLIPIAVLSLFSLSAAVMGYVFLYQPIQLYLDGKKKNAVDLFVKTVAYFAVITIVLFILLFLRIIK